MKDEELNKTVTPTLVNLNQRHGGNNHDVVIVTPPHNPNNVRIGVVNQSGCVTAVAPRKVMSFEKVITKSQSRAGQTLMVEGSSLERNKVAQQQLNQSQQISILMAASAISEFG
ncbi:Zn-dependent oxidoreductase [Sesbania bispinosa]|nr:Zn-dependent oxidoreductase [Sesbania bispinosa]